ncbi:hypothetical protein EDB19DRAFT_1670092 [Suillus lakei]|nr:hypothetical protein EDB19DRAFT_1670092 [Suillus lakei]
MLVLPGSSALSSSKRQALLQHIKIIKPDVISVDAVYIHLVKSPSQSLQDDLANKASPQRQAIDLLLDYGDDISFPSTSESLHSGHNIFYILPRAGSISPWSSKATDIAANDEDLGKEELTALSHLLHDRMTQSGVIFQHHTPSPLRTVELRGEGEAVDADVARDKLSTANKALGLALAADEIDYLVEAFVSGSSPINRNPTDAELFIHKIFNASWTIDETLLDRSLFQMIRNTEKISPLGTISAYSDNAAVLEGSQAPRFGVHPSVENMPILIKVETHNHPTAVSPYPGAATGSGGEIRDEGAAGLAGFTVSNLLIPGYEQPWETDFGPLDIMIEGPLGASAFNNEFGRPALAGYFRTFSESVPASEDGSKREIRGYHKPIMIAGGYGNVRPQISPGAKIIVLGGPGMLIGLGGGAASSQVSGASSAELDFASVQRENAEMQRRCQQGSPIQSIHDVGAGGLSNALPELVHDSGLGAKFEIRDVLIWCNESQERYVLACFERIAQRERCPFSIVGVATEEEELIVTDRLLLQDPPRMSRKDTSRKICFTNFDTALSKYLPNSSALSDRLSLAVDRVLRLPSVGSKTITGLVTLADVAVTRSSYGFDVLSGEAMAMGERTPVALLNPSASARMAIAEALTNLAAASVSSLSRVKLSEGACLYAAVAAVGMELCPALGVGIPWKQGEEQREVSAPLSLIVTAFAPVNNLRTDLKETTVLTRMGGSALAQAPDVEHALTKIKKSQPDLVLAYHDRSDGGLFTTLAEMCFAGRAGAVISLDTLHSASDPELGAVVQVRDEFVDVGFPSTSIHVIGRVNIDHSDQLFAINHESKELQQAWAETSYPRQEFDLIKDHTHMGLFYDLTFDLSSRPKVAILREQGVNGHVEMAWAFTAAGFDAVDLSLSRFRGLAACGGFSYGDVLGAGKGWAHSVLLNDVARKEFTHFFADKNTFTLGVCNGCQWLNHWPDFKQNASERFEGLTKASVFLRDMVGSKLPVAVAHGEGRREALLKTGLVALQYIDSAGEPTEVYPLNPNGSPNGITGVQTIDGRILALENPWFRLFQSARAWTN